MTWRPTARGFSSAPYEIVRNSRGGFGVWLTVEKGMRLLNLECDDLPSAKAFAEHHQEINSSRMTDDLHH